MIKVNLCQKLLFLHQLTHNMTKDCSLNYEFSIWDIPCIARVMVRITLSGGVANVSQQAGWNNF